MEKEVNVQMNDVYVVEHESEANEIKADECDENAPETDKTKPKKTSGAIETCINEVNTIIGSGVISLSYGLTQAGLIVGCFCLSISSVLAAYSVNAIIRAGTLCKKNTYQEMVTDALKIWGSVIISICQIVYPLFANISYFIAIHNNIADILKFTNSVNKWYFDSRLYLSLVVFVIILPLSCLKNISRLAKASFISLVCVAIYSLLIIIRAPSVMKETFYFPNFVSYGRADFVNGFSVFAFALSCHHAVQPLFRAMDVPSIKKFAYVNHMAMLFTTIFYAIIGYVGYFAFGGNANGNLIAGYCTDDLAMLIARGCFTITVILTSPLQTYASREGINTLFYKRSSFKWIIHMIITLAIVGFCFLLALLVDQISIVVSLSGSLIASPIIFILPGLCLLIHMKQGFRPDNLTKVACYAMIVFGAIIFFVGTIVSILEIRNKEPDPIRYWCSVELSKMVIPGKLTTRYNSVWSY